MINYKKNRAQQITNKEVLVGEVHHLRAVIA